MEAGGKGGIRCYQGECYERGSARLHAQPGDHIYVHYKDYTLPKPYGIDGCAMPGDYTVDTEPFNCDHLDIYNFAKVKEANPISHVALKKVSILPYEKPNIDELNKINDDINTQKRLVKLEQSRVEKMGIETTYENMIENSMKYEGLITKISDLENDAIELKKRLKEHNNPSNSKTFLEGESVYLIATFQSDTYAENQFIFAAQAEHVESGHIDYVGMTSKQTITKKALKDATLEWIPKESGQYILKLYALDSRTMGAVLKDPVINHIHVEPTNSNLASGPESTKN